ncbi:MAG TPA: aromatic ring-hydroxylating dioxygenase subunit alpha [Acidiferrobacterales bacterium]|nr:aromatic ring-hydroxylating dioxygenase subunit alpha [Acidiferrobacterales bacterium]
MALSPEELVIEGERDFRVHTAVYTDPAIFQLEMARIFETTWVYVAHESELPNPGDYLTTTIGTQPAIVSRDADGKIHVMLNRCRHRGSVVCRAERGNTEYFRCPYHNWTYGRDGSLVAPAQKSGYPEDMNYGALSLARAQVDTYRGLIFARLSADGETLAQRLAQVAQYIDLWVERSPIGKITLPRGAHRYFYPANWKFQMENGNDGYHGNYVHESFMKVVSRAGQKTVQEFVAIRNTGSVVGLRYGDGFIDRPYGGMAGQFDYHDPRLADYHGQLEQAYGRKRMEEILGQRNLLIFPNLFLFESHIRVIKPLSVNETVVVMHPTRLEGAPEELNRERLRTHERFFGPAGFGAPDDIEIFVTSQTGMKAKAVDWLLIHRGMHRETLKNGVHVGAHSTDEAPQRAAYREWKRRMTGARRNPDNDAR